MGISFPTNHLFIDTKSLNVWTTAHWWWNCPPPPNPARPIQISEADGLSPLPLIRFTTSKFSHSERGNHIRYQLRIRGRSNGLFDWCHQSNPVLHFPYSFQTFYNLLWLSEADPSTWILLKIFHVFLLLCFILCKLHSQTQAVHLWHPNCTGNDVTIVMPSANI